MKVVLFPFKKLHNLLSNFLHQKYYLIIEGKWTGVVSTVRVTHATPAAAYASVADRGWESDADLVEDEATHCKDIAAQLIDEDYG